MCNNVILSEDFHWHENAATAAAQQLHADSRQNATATTVVTDWHFFDASQFEIKDVYCALSFF
jgi:hypothetical protein